MHTHPTYNPKGPKGHTELSYWVGVGHGLLGFLSYEHTWVCYVLHVLWPYYYSNKVVGAVGGFKTSGVVVLIV
jgi:hypothetical protein